MIGTVQSYKLAHEALVPSHAIRTGLTSILVAKFTTFTVTSSILRTRIGFSLSIKNRHLTVVSTSADGHYELYVLLDYKCDALRPFLFLSINVFATVFALYFFLIFSDVVRGHLLTNYFSQNCKYLSI